jgi:hypothetical protein
VFGAFDLAYGSDGILNDLFDFFTATLREFRRNAQDDFADC